MFGEHNKNINNYAEFIKDVKGPRKYFCKSTFAVATLIKWLVIGVSVGIIVGVIAVAFGKVLECANAGRAEYPLIVLALPVGGLVIVWLYHVCKNTNDSGTNMVISSIHSSTGIPFRMAPLIFVSTVITHLLGGSAGREGAAIQLGGSIANKLGRMIRLNEKDRNIIVMCGMSAGFSALFGTPMAAAIFALEVISIGIMHYSALVPCVTAAMIAHFVADFFALKPEMFGVTEIPAMNLIIFFKIILFAALVGGVSIIFCIVLHKTERMYKKYLKNPYVRIFVAGCIIVLLSAILRTDMYLGSGITMIEEVFHNEKILGYAFLLKMLFTALTLGAGYKGGEIVPSFCIGATFGCAVAGLFGLPATLVGACGMVGLFCGVTNCPLTSLLISFELFGFEGMPYYLITVAVSYMLSGYYGLYHAQKIMYSKTETNFVNKVAH